MRLEDYERAVVDLLFKKDFTKSLAALSGASREEAAESGDPRASRESPESREQHRWRVYRRMARSRLTDAIEASFPRFFQVVEAGPLVERWFDEAPPKTPFLRNVAGEFAAWLRPEVLPPGAPPWALELARHEWSRLEVSYAHQEEGAAEVREVFELSFERPAVLTPSHRIVRVGHAVHRIPEEVPEGLEVAEGEQALCLYRDPATHEVRVLELSPIAAAILEEVAVGGRSVVEAVRAASVRASFVIDGALVGALAELVADLHDRGVWLGSS